jgi:hypothetical protein
LPRKTCPHSAAILGGRRDVKKRDLPGKVCPVCGRPARWCKKWRDDRESVVYCNRRCHSETKSLA